MGLSTARLSISENSSIIAKKHILNQAISSLGVDELLGRVLVEHMIIGKGFSVIGIVKLVEPDLVVLLVGYHDTLAPALLLFCVHRPHTHHHLNCLAHFPNRRFLSNLYVQTTLNINKVLAGPFSLYKTLKLLIILSFILPWQPFFVLSSRLKTIVDTSFPFNSLFDILYLILQEKIRIRSNKHIFVVFLINLDNTIKTN